MNKKILSNVLLIAIVAASIFGCENSQKVKTITADTPYYSVTTGSFERDRNVYMDLDIKIPMITYSNNEGSELIDSLNNEIESSLTSLIDAAKEKALNTYETYLQSAKDNAKKDIENRIAEIASKYESILGDEEKDILSKLSADDIVNYSFSNMGRMNTFSNFISSDSEIVPSMKRRFDKNNFIPKSNDTVSGFTGTQDLIIPGLHNKNIIVVETTTATHTETSIKIEGRPGIAPSEGFERPRRSSQSNMPPRDNFMNETEKVKPSFKATKSIAVTEETNSPFTKQTLISTPSKIESSDNASELNKITLDDFYKDLRQLRKYNIPDDYVLTIQYIPTSIECHYEVKCLDEDYLSLFVELSESRTTSNVKRLFYNVDLNNKKIVNLKNILGEKFKETCVKCITETIDKWSDEQKATLIDNYSIDNYISENTPFFINNNHKPVIEIEKFAITIGSTGYHEFQIP